MTQPAQSPELSVVTCICCRFGDLEFGSLGSIEATLALVLSGCVP